MIYVSNPWPIKAARKGFASPGARARPGDTNGSGNLPFASLPPRPQLPHPPRLPGPPEEAELRAFVRIARVMTSVTGTTAWRTKGQPACVMGCVVEPRGASTTGSLWVAVAGAGNARLFLPPAGRLRDSLSPAAMQAPACRGRGARPPPLSFFLCFVCFLKASKAGKQASKRRRSVPGREFGKIDP